MFSCNQESLYSAPFFSYNLFWIKRLRKKHKADISKLCGPQLHSTRNFHIGEACTGLERRKKELSSVPGAA